MALRANFKMYSRSAKGGEKGDPNRNPWLAKMAEHKLVQNTIGTLIFFYLSLFVCLFVCLFLFLFYLFVCIFVFCFVCLFVWFFVLFFL